MLDCSPHGSSEEAVNGALVDLDDLLVEDVLSLTEHELGLSGSRLFSLADPAFLFSSFDVFKDFFLFLEPEQLLAEPFEGLCNGLTLNPLQEGVLDSLAVTLLKKSLLLLILKLLDIRNH